MSLADIIAIGEATASLGIVIVIWKMFMADRRNQSAVHKTDIEALQSIIQRHTDELERMDKRLRECEDARLELVNRIAKIENGGSNNG